MSLTTMATAGDDKRWREWLQNFVSLFPLRLSNGHMQTVVPLFMYIMNTVHRILIVNIIS